jgi:hypothetical protein
MTLVGASALTAIQRGFAAAITGINVESRSRAYAPEYKEYLLDHVGEKLVFVIGATETKVSVKGQKTLATGLPAIVFGTANTVMSDLDGYGQTAGGLYADSVTLNETNTGWLEFDLVASRNSKIA